MAHPTELEALYAFLVAAGVTALLTPLSMRLARRVGAMDEPRERGLSNRPTPLLGGLAIFAGVLTATLVVLPTGYGKDHELWLGVLAGAAVITLVGAVDDRFDLHPAIKFCGQVIAAVIVVNAGVAVKKMTLPFIGELTFPNAGITNAGPVLTVIGLVVMMNVVNFSDGVDGLAAGVCVIIAAAMAVIAFDLGRQQPGVLAALTAGAALGFLIFNFPPASSFMGDAGANLLGYLLGVAAVVGSLKTNAFVALLVPLVILAIPFLDTGFVIAKRLKYRRKPWSADANHFHHRMARIGFSQRKTVAYLYGWSVLMAALAVALRLYHRHHHQTGWIALIVLLGLVCLAASIYLVCVLEIFKFKGLRAQDLRASQPEATEAEIEETVTHDLETGEFEKVK
jgi:UDP-GlcNAc:undecaprenyl-phosphate/decaprenyl-phosphate GlcNAc-1-phosphate transferase